jgi:hypothetical protein
MGFPVGVVFDQSSMVFDHSPVFCSSNSEGFYGLAKEFQLPSLSLVIEEETWKL